MTDRGSRFRSADSAVPGLSSGAVKPEISGHDKRETERWPRNVREWAQLIDSNDKLSDREWLALRLTKVVWIPSRADAPEGSGVSGLSLAEAAAWMNTNEKTLKGHLEGGLEKLGLARPHVDVRRRTISSASKTALYDAAGSRARCDLCGGRLRRRPLISDEAGFVAYRDLVGPPEWEEAG